MDKCTSCGKLFEQKEWMVKQCHHYCNRCTREKQKAYKAARKEAGKPVQSGRASHRRCSMKTQAFEAITLFAFFWVAAFAIGAVS